MVWSLAKVDHSSHRTSTLLTSACESILPYLPELNTEQISRLLWALSSLRHYCPELYTALTSQTLQQIQDFQPQQLCDVLHAFANMLHDPGALLQPLADKLTKQPEQLSARGICKVLWSLTVLDTLSREVFDRMCWHVADRPLTDFRPQVNAATSGRVMLHM